MAPTRPCEPSVFEGANKSTLVDICRLGIITPPRAARLDILEFTHTHTHTLAYTQDTLVDARHSDMHTVGRVTIREEEARSERRRRHGQRG